MLFSLQNHKTPFQKKGVKGWDMSTRKPATPKEATKSGRTNHLEVHGGIVILEGALSEVFGKNTKKQPALVFFGGESYFDTCSC